MNKLVRLQAIALSESGMTQVTLVGFLACMYPQMSFQFIGVWTGIATQMTLVGAFTCKKYCLL